MEKRKVFNDSVFDSIIYLAVRNVKTIMRILWIAVSMSIGFGLGYWFATMGKPNEFSIMFWLIGGVISICVGMFIMVWNDYAEIEYGRTRLKEFASQVQERYEE